MLRAIFLLACFSLVGCVEDYRIPQDVLSDEFDVRRSVIKDGDDTVELEYSSPYVLRRHAIGMDLLDHEKSNEEIDNTNYTVPEGGTFRVKIIRQNVRDLQSEDFAFVVSIEGEKISASINPSEMGYVCFGDIEDETQEYESCEIDISIEIDRKINEDEAVEIQVIDNVFNTTRTFTMTKRETSALKK